MGFFNSIGDAFKKVYSDVKGGIGHLYNSLDTKVNTVIKAVSKVPNVVDDLGSKVISGTKNIANNVINKGSSIVETGELTLIIPLALIGVGLLFFLKNQNSSSLADTSGNIARGASSAAVAM
jgi:phage-related protein